MLITLSTLSIALGLAIALVNLFGLFNPAQFASAARKFPRSTTTGIVLMIIAVAGFLWNVSHESLSDFESIKPLLFILFVGVGVGTMVFVQDFLAVRGLAILLLLLAKIMVDAERWAVSEWRLVIATMAYIFVVLGMWFTVSPWRLRDFLFWATANEKRVRIGSAIRVAFGLFVVFLGMKIF